MASTKLRLLLEASVRDPLARQIQQLVAGVSYVRDIPVLRDAADDTIYQHAQMENRVIVDLDGDFNETRYPPGPENPGIIRFSSSRQHDYALLEIFKTFWTCGIRQHCKHSVTYLTLKGVRIRSVHQEISHQFSHGRFKPSPR